ncbi:MULTISPECIES: ABC transporter permease [Halolamina]|uniref:NitT/TauT family transport system permease protein n=1 Tax=Halolamina pelagica TaxID=699431 RepID=A0A1I5MJE1_9EURY|nr:MULTISPECIES: ABC transporter permease [Halolamina]NHX36056.1 ABC transporter permease [Halolamina sp. R1-12]SFP09724.1 NitT/TauT family transport system permease protein [Halolamina pelagica]
MTAGRLPEWAYPAVTLVGAVVLWAGFVSLFDVPAYLLPHPLAVGRRLAGDPGLYADAAVATTVKVLVGGAAGSLAGFVLGVAVGELPPLWRAVSPYLIAARVLPVVAIAPLLLIYFGTGFATGIAFVALMTLFPMAVSTAAGFRQTPEAALDLAASVDAPRHRVLLSIRLPYAVPDVVGGLRQAATLAVVGSVLAEWFVADSGLGYLILVAAENVRPDVLLAALSVVFLVGFSLYGAVGLLGSRLRRAVA